METSSVVVMIVLIALGALVFTGGLVAFILFVVRRREAHFVAELEAEGILRRSGRVVVGTSLTKYRSPRFGIASRAVSRKGGELVLTEEKLAVVSQRVFYFALPDTEVWVEGTKLHLRTERPMDASGTIDISAKLPDAAAWRDLLVERGATPRR